MAIMNDYDYMKGLYSLQWHVNKRKVLLFKRAIKNKELA
jgi:hypothetical protein